MGILEQIAGILLLGLGLLDLFVTVLYARAGSGIVSKRLSRGLWRVARPMARFSWGQSALAYCGPAILVLVVLSWILMVVGGITLILQPHLGHSIVSTNGTTPKNFAAALYAAASSTTIMGPGGLEPVTPASRVFYFFTAAVGVMLTTLSLTYIMQVYSALLRRNTTGLKFHFCSRRTADAAVCVASFGAGGEFQAGYTNLSEMAAELIATKESHHLYPLLYYFRFREDYYSTARTVLLALDTVTLMRSVLDEERYRWLLHSVGVTHLWDSSFMLLHTLENAFMRSAPHEMHMDEVTRRLWAQRYEEAARIAREAGQSTSSEPEIGAERYIDLRCEWQPHVEQLAHAMAYSMSEVDPVTERLRKELGMS